MRIAVTCDYIQAKKKSKKKIKLSLDDWKMRWSWAAVSLHY